MVHYTCDACGQSLSRDRFILKIEICPAPETGVLGDGDLDSDPLQEIADELSVLSPDDDVDNLPDPFSSHRQHFDLCAGCRRKFLQDPLAVSHRRLKFSGN